MILYKVETEETVRRSFFIRAETEDEAKEGAEALSSLVPEYDSEDDFRVTPFTGEPGAGSWVWAGGVKGDWETRNG